MFTPARSSDRLLRRLFAAAALSSVLAMAAIFVFLFLSSLPAIRYSGWSFLTGVTWNLGNMYSLHPAVHNGVTAPPGAVYGIFSFIAGTLLTSIIALVIAIPVSLGTAILLTEFLPRRVAAPLSVVVELLAGVPSVVFGLWGLAVVVPWVGQSVGPLLSRVLGFWPFFRTTASSGQGLLAAGLVLAIMVIPIITATTRDLLQTTPASIKDGAVALGLTHWETIRAVSLPWSRAGILGAVILGLGRALGETMAVLMIGGNAVGGLPGNITAPISTMATVIVSALDSAFSDATGMAIHALALIALTLLAITVAVNIPARILITRQQAERLGR